MTGADLTTLISALEATWPPAGGATVSDCRIRTAPGAGSRVNSIRPLRYDLDDAAIAAAEAETLSLTGTRLWALPDGDQAPADALSLTERLIARGYERFDESLLLAGETNAVLDAASQRAEARKDDPELGSLIIRCPLAAVDRIWSAGGIGAERQAVMHRAKGPHEIFGGRLGHRMVGLCFAAVDPDTGIAFVHALEVGETSRGKGVGPVLMRTAAKFALRHGASELAVAVRSSNANGRALFGAIGLEPRGGYVYLRKEN